VQDVINYLTIGRHIYNFPSSIYQDENQPGATGRQRSGPCAEISTPSHEDLRPRHDHGVENFLRAVKAKG